MANGPETEQAGDDHPGRYTFMIPVKKNGVVSKGSHRILPGFIFANRNHRTDVGVARFGRRQHLVIELSAEMKNRTLLVESVPEGDIFAHLPDGMYSLAH
jgi:hypothetical protein